MLLRSPTPQMAEAAAQLLQAGDLQGAADKSAAALQLDELHQAAGLVSLECQLLAGELQEAAQQLDFMQVRGQATMLWIDGSMRGRLRRHRVIAHPRSPPHCRR